MRRLSSFEWLLILLIILILLVLVVFEVIVPAIVKIDKRIQKIRTMEESLAEVSGFFLDKIY